MIWPKRLGELLPSRGNSRRRPSSVVVNHCSKLFLYETTGSIRTRLGMNVSQGVLYRTYYIVFVLSKNMATVTKIEYMGQTEVFCIYL